jgi:AraC family transcriptional regulator of adaptative response/methylated-DNA-[protein]-cysteine methyltransferase
MSVQEEINYQRIEKAITWLSENYLRQPTLQEVAETVHVSEFHFQKLFSEWVGISPKRFMQFLTVQHLKQKLAGAKNLQEVSDAANLSAQARVYDLFTTLEAVTPQEYKTKGAAFPIQYGFHTTPFGLALLGVTHRGVCWLSFVTDENNKTEQLAHMQAHWHNSRLEENTLLTGSYCKQIFYNTTENKTAAKGLHAVVKGTNFQIKVWLALLQIPYGEVTTYQHIAQAVGKPKALQAVGSAVGANSLAYLIPCHRVIRKDGVLGEYRWLASRKKSIIGYEMAKAYSSNDK